MKKQKLDSKTQIQTKPTTDSDFLPWIKVFYIFVWLQLVYHSELFVEKIRHNKNGKYLTIIDSLNFSQFDQCIQIIICHNCSTLDVIHNLSQFAIESKYSQVKKREIPTIIFGLTNKPQNLLQFLYMLIRLIFLWQELSTLLQAEHLLLSRSIQQQRKRYFLSDFFVQIMNSFCLCSSLWIRFHCST